MHMAVQKIPLAVFHFTRVFPGWVSTIDKNLQWLYKLPERIELYRQPGEQTTPLIIYNTNNTLVTISFIQKFINNT